MRKAVSTSTCWSLTGRQALDSVWKGEKTTQAADLPAAMIDMETTRVTNKASGTTTCRTCLLMKCDGGAEREHVAALRRRALKLQDAA